MLLDAQRIVEKSEELSPEAFNKWVRQYVKDLVVKDFQADAPDVEFYEGHVSIQFGTQKIQDFADHIIHNLFSDMGGTSAYSSSLLMLEYIYMLDPDREYFRDKPELSTFIRQLTVALATTGTLLSFADAEKYELWSGWWEAYNKFMTSFKQMDREGHFNRRLLTKETILLGQEPEEEQPRTITDWLADGIKEVRVSDIVCWQGTARCTCTPTLYDLESERFTEFMIAGMWELNGWICPECLKHFEPSDQLVDNMAKGRWISARELHR